MLPICARLLCFTTAAAIVPLAQAQVEFFDLQTLYNSGLGVYGVSADGSYVGGHLQTAVRWSQSNGFEDCGTVAGFTHGAYHTRAISGDGQTLVGFWWAADAKGIRSFRWSPVSGLELLPLEAGNVGSQAHAISFNGTVITGGVRDATADHAFRWTAQDGHVLLGELFPGPGAYSYGKGISADGSVIVGYCGQVGVAVNRPFRWTAASGMQALPTPLDHVVAGAHCVSSNGLFAVGASRTASGPTTAVLWAEGQPMLSLGMLNGGTYSEARSVSDDGLMVVGVANGGGGLSDNRAFAWTPYSGMFDFTTYLAKLGHSSPYGTLSVATAISGDGTTIVGGDYGWAARSGCWPAVFMHFEATEAACGEGSAVLQVRSAGQGEIAPRWQVLSEAGEWLALADGTFDQGAAIQAIRWLARQPVSERVLTSGSG